MKKFFSLVLALVMALSLTTVAWGADPVADATELKAAITDAGIAETTIEIGANVTINMVGITFPANAKITFQSADATNPATLDFSSQGYNQYLNGNGGTFTFKNLNIKRATGVYTGLAHSTSETYENCNITGLFFGYSPTVSFTDCSFNSNGAEHCVWTYSADMSFTRCDFTYTDRAVNAYSDQAADASAVSFNDCVFTKSGSTASAGAIEINSSNMTSVDLSVEDTTVSQGELWWVSGWDSDYGSSTSVEEDGVEYAAAEVNGVKYITLGAAIQAANDGDTITLLDDIKLVDGPQHSSHPGALNVDKDITIDLAGHDISSAAGSNEGIKATADVTIEDSKGGSSVSVPLAEDTNGDIIVTGGSYTDDVSAYVAPGKQLLANGTVVATPAANSTAPVLYVADNSTAGWATYCIATGADLDDLKQGADENCLPCYLINGDYYTEVSPAVAVYKLVYGAKTVYLNPVDSTDVCYDAEASVFTNVTKKTDQCGKLVVTDTTKTYYVFYDELDDDEDYYFVATKNGSIQLLVNGKIVDVELHTVQALTAHKWVGYDVTNNAYTSVKCENCEKVAKLYANKTAAGKNAVYVDDYGWITAASAALPGTVVTPSTDKTVTSADTFDAGIAMYVGMSVMAAAGSAVVIGKKKD